MSAILRRGRNVRLQLASGRILIGTVMRASPDEITLTGVTVRERNEEDKEVASMVVSRWVIRKAQETK